MLILEGFLKENASTAADSYLGDDKRLYFRFNKIPVLKYLFSPENGMSDTEKRLVRYIRLCLFIIATVLIIDLIIVILVVLFS